MAKKTAAKKVKKLTKKQIEKLRARDLPCCSITDSEDGKYTTGVFLVGEEQVSVTLGGVPRGPSGSLRLANAALDKALGKKK